MPSPVRPLPIADHLQRKHLPALDGLRAFAIALVMLFHYGVPGVSGSMGVTIFFSLSGFLITWLLLQERDKTGDVSLSRFYARRTLRIMPAYFAFVALYLALSYLKHDRWSLGNIAAAATYTMDWYLATGVRNAKAIPLWSLAVEEHFYLVWPFVLLTLLRLGRRRAIAGVAVLIAAGVAWRGVGTLAFGMTGDYAQYAFDARFDNLLIGCLLALLIHRSSAGFDRIATLTVRWPWLPYVTLVMLFAQSEGPGWYAKSFEYSVTALLAALFILQLLQLQTVHRWGWQWFTNPAAQWIGRLSYSLYLYHSLGESLFQRLPLPNTLTMHVVGSTAMSIALASASYYGVERPFLRWKKRFEAQSKQQIA